MKQDLPYTTDLSLYNNETYKPGPALKRICWYLVSEFFFRTGWFPFYGLKRSFLRWFGARVGEQVYIKPRVNIKYPWFLDIGDHSWIGEHVWIDNLAPVSIGAHVCISQGAMLLCGNHDYTRTTFDLRAKPIVLENGVWIGAQAVVCGGVRCMNHSVLTVGSIATRNLSAYSIYQGNPAEKKKERVLKG